MSTRWSVTFDCARPRELAAFWALAPIHGPDGAVVAAVSLVVAYDRATVVSLVPLVRAAGRTISRALAAPAPPVSSRPRHPVGDRRRGSRRGRRRAGTCC